MNETFNERYINTTSFRLHNQKRHNTLANKTMCLSVTSSMFFKNCVSSVESVTLRVGGGWPLLDQLKSKSPQSGQVEVPTSLTIFISGGGGYSGCYIPEIFLSEPKLLAA